MKPREQKDDLTAEHRWTVAKVKLNTALIALGGKLDGIVYKRYGRTNEAQ